jgi:hypothetical protein
MLEPDLLDEQVISQQGRYKRIKRWWRGIHPDRGIIIQGLTGWETVEEKDRIDPVQTFTVRNE